MRKVKLSLQGIRDNREATVLDIDMLVSSGTDYDRVSSWVTQPTGDALAVSCTCMRCIGAKPLSSAQGPV